MEAKYEFPLLFDRHTHVSFYAALGGAADLSGCRGAGEALALLRRRRRAPLVTARGWRSGLYDLPRAELDRLGPVAVTNLSLHGFALNGPARDLLRRDYPEVVRNIDDQAWVERNLNRVFEIFTGAGGGAAIPAYMDSLAAQGVWRAADMLAADDASALLLARRYAGRCELWSEPACFARLGAAAKKAVGGLKIFTDGALGSRSAALRGRYLGGGRGLLLHTDEELSGLVRLCARRKPRLAVHAIGEEAIGQVLRVLARLGIPRGELAVRLEHAQFITLAQARRARRLGVALCMQPNFSGDSADYADRLPAALRRANNPFRMLIDRAGFEPGRDLLFGSDGMPHGAGPALQAALFPPEPGQRLKPEEFRAGYCLPGFGPGRLEASVDAARRRVSVRVRLAKKEGK